VLAAGVSGDPSASTPEIAIAARRGAPRSNAKVYVATAAIAAGTAADTIASRCTRSPMSTLPKGATCHTDEIPARATAPTRAVPGALFVCQWLSKWDRSMVFAA